MIMRASVQTATIASTLFFYMAARSEHDSQFSSIDVDDDRHLTDLKQNPDSEVIIVDDVGL